MTHRQIVTAMLRGHGALSAYGVYHVARAYGHRLSPSSARSRLAELEADGHVVRVGREPTPTRTATVYALRR